MRERRAKLDHVVRRYSVRVNGGTSPRDVEIKVSFPKRVASDRDTVEALLKCRLRCGYFSPYEEARRQADILSFDCLGERSMSSEQHQETFHELSLLHVRKLQGYADSQ